ncbi:MAG: DsbA family protein [Proteobacteria bacterium]|nr:DsbA family protein [Pseudomonadota bacterium]
MSDALSIDVFWSFRSPWSYLATPRLTQWQRRFNLEVCFRPVYPIAIRTPEFFNTVNPLWGRYFAIDLRRVADFLEIPLTWPQPDPVVQCGGGVRVGGGEAHPTCGRAARRGGGGEEGGGGTQLPGRPPPRRGGGTQNGRGGDHPARPAADAGLDLEDLDARALKDADRLEEVISKNEEDHSAAGHWGVPTCAFRGEPFFGQDRLDVLMWRLKENGLEER